MYWETVGSSGYGRSSKSDNKFHIVVQASKESFEGKSFPIHIFLQVEVQRGRTRGAKYSVDLDKKAQTQNCLSEEGWLEHVGQIIWQANG